MKSLNRTLSLVLVLVMVFGLFGVASAATFTDSAKIQYTEAVGVMTGIGAINGYTDGTFGPTATITREEAAKMVTFAILGPTVAKTLSVTATGFSDVAADRWSSPFIAYCVSQGIINGMGDGTFAPTANVTGYQLAKMMLCAAGYGKASEFTGASWELNVAVTANKLGVFTGSKATSFSTAATREEAALYVFNALVKVPVVSYSKLTESYTKASNFTATVAIPNDPHFNSDTYSEIGEDVYTTLAKVSVMVGGVPGYVWQLNAVNVSGFCAGATVLATSTDGTSLTNLVSPSDPYYIGKIADTSPAVTYYKNDAASVVGTVTTDSAIPGAIIKFVDTDSDGYYDIVSSTVKTVEKLAAAPTTTTSGAVTYVTVGSLTNILSTNITYPSDLAKGDVVLYYTVGGKYYVEKATSVTGTISSFTSAYVTINGSKYYPSGLYLTGGASANVTIGALQALIAKAGYTFYLDNGGNIVYVAAPSVTASVTNTLFVAATDSTSSFGTTTYKAIAVKPDGTQSTITVYKTAKYSGTLTAVCGTTLTSLAGGTAGLDDSELVAGYYYTYSTNTDGTYNLTAAQAQSIYATDLTVTATAGSNAIDVNDTSYIVTGNQAAFLTSVKCATDDTWASPTTIANQSTPIATAGTIFMYYDSTAKTYTVKTGIASALTYAAGGTINVLKDSTGTYATVVICSGASSTASTSGYDQYFISSGTTTTVDANGNVLYSYTAIANGVTGKTITSYSTLAKGTLYFAKDYAANGAITAGSAYSLATLGATVGTTLTPFNVAYAGGVLSVTTSALATTSYVVSSSAPIYLVSVAASGATTVSTITADVADAMNYAAGNDSINLVRTSSSDATIAAIYIYHNVDATATLTYVNTNYIVYSNVGCTTVVTSPSEVAPGTTLYVRSTSTAANLSELTSTAATLISDAAAVDGTSAAIYHFSMPSTNLLFTAAQA